MTATRSPFSISSDVLSNSMRSWYPCVSFSMLSARCLLPAKRGHLGTNQMYSVGVASAEPDSRRAIWVAVCYGLRSNIACRRCRKVCIQSFLVPR